MTFPLHVFGISLFDAIKQKRGASLSVITDTTFAYRVVHKIGKDTSKYFTIRTYETGEAETEITFSLSRNVAYRLPIIPKVSQVRK